MFLPPELEGADSLSALSQSPWQSQTGNELLRTLYFQRSSQSPQNEKVERYLVDSVIAQAKKVISHPSRPMERRLHDFRRAPWGEIALEETLEENPTLEPFNEFFVETNEERPFSCVAMLDASSSMSGDKHLLSSIAAAVLFLKAEPILTSLVLFSSKAKAIKRLGENSSIEATLLKFLRHHPRGFTNISAGLAEGLKQLGSRGLRGRRVGILATDGRATEGGDPLLVARRYDFLLVLHLHGPGSSLDHSKELAACGNGMCLEVEALEELPNRLYDALRILSRL